MPAAEGIEEHAEKKKIADEDHPADPSAHGHADRDHEKDHGFDIGPRHLLEKTDHEIEREHISGGEGDVFGIIHALPEEPRGDRDQKERQERGAPAFDLFGREAGKEKEIKTEKRVSEVAYLKIAQKVIRPGKVRDIVENIARGQSVQGVRKNEEKSAVEVAVPESGIACIFSEA